MGRVEAAVRAADEALKPIEPPASVIANPQKWRYEGRRIELSTIVERSRKKVSLAKKILETIHKDHAREFGLEEEFQLFVTVTSLKEDMTSLSDALVTFQFVAGENSGDIDEPWKKPLKSVETSRDLLSDAASSLEAELHDRLFDADDKLGHWKKRE